MQPSTAPRGRKAVKMGSSATVSDRADGAGDYAGRPRGLRPKFWR